MHEISVESVILSRLQLFIGLMVLMIVIIINKRMSGRTNPMLLTEQVEITIILMSRAGVAIAWFASGRTNILIKHEYVLLLIRQGCMEGSLHALLPACKRKMLEIKNYIVNYKVTSCASISV